MAQPSKKLKVHQKTFASDTNANAKQNPPNISMAQNHSAVSRHDANINDERSVRLRKLHELVSAGVNAYPARVSRHHRVAEALGADHGTSVQVAGRIMSKRDMGKITFGDLQDETGRVQVLFKQDTLDAQSYTRLVKHIDKGDVIAVSGERFQTERGAESILAREWTLLAKALLPIPDDFYGLADEEKRYRKRYLD